MQVDDITNPNGLVLLVETVKHPWKSEQDLHWCGGRQGFHPTQFRRCDR